MISPQEFETQWPGELWKIEFPAPKPLLPTGTVAFLHYAGLPRCYTVDSNVFIVELKFHATAIHLPVVWSTEMGEEWAMPAGWNRFWKIGDVSYGQASAWICIEELTGNIVGIDVDEDKPIYTVNSSVECLAVCLKCLIDWQRETDGQAGHLDRLWEMFASLDGFKNSEPGLYWKDILESSVEAGCERFKILFE